MKTVEKILDVSEGVGGVKLDWNSDAHYPQSRKSNLNLVGCGPGKWWGRQKSTIFADAINGWPQSWLELITCRFSFVVAFVF